MTFAKFTAPKLIGAALLAAVLGAPAAQAEMLRFSSFEPPMAFITKEILGKWADQVSADSGGALSVKMFAGGTLGRSPAQQLQIVEDGVADLAWIVPGYNPGRFEGMTVGELPFLVTSAEAGSVAMWTLYEKGMLTGDFDKFKVIGLFTSSPNAVVSVDPVAMPADMKGLNFRSSSPTLLSALTELGAVPVGGITGPTIAESISRGLIAGTFNEWNAIETFRIGEAAHNVLELPMGTSPLMVVMNRAKFDALPEAAKAAIDAHSGMAFAHEFGAAFDAKIDELRAASEAGGKMTVTVADEATLAAWKAAVQPVTDAWIAATPNGADIYKAFAEAEASVQ